MRGQRAWGGRRGGGRGSGRGGGWGGGSGKRGRWRGGIGGRGGERRGGTSGWRGDDDGPSVNQLGFQKLQDLETKTPDEIILYLTSSSYFPAIESLLKQQSIMKDEWVVLIVSVLIKACDCSSSENLLKLLLLLPGSSFLNLHLRKNLNSLSASSMSDVAVFLRNVVKLMNELLRRFPNSYDDLPVSDLYCGTRMLSDTGQLADDSLVIEVDELMKLRSEKAEELKKKEEEEKRQKMKPRRNAGANDDVNPPENFRYLSIVPTQEDILTGERPFLRRNKIDGSYDDAEHYLDVQFRLLREDFMRPLREGIAQFLERIGSANIGNLQDIRVYKDVRLLYPVCTSNGLRYRIEFDNTKLRHIRWENSKRLIFGSLMCLSNDNFDSFVFATVANRELSEIQRGRVDIQFIHLYDHMGLEEGDVYQMVESTVYFEAYRHVLEGLKYIDERELPFQNYIVNCQKEVEPPAYLRSRFQEQVEPPAFLRNRLRLQKQVEPRLQEQVTFDLTPIMKKTSSVPDTTASTATPRKWLRLRLAGLSVRDDVRKVSSIEGANVPLLDLASWPSAEDLGLDDSQFRALQMALTKEFAVIQGPPGTGKTYIGLKIANVLLHNKHKWVDKGARYSIYPRVRNRPILVVCYTNHALDQFLEGIHQFHPEGIVRVGGRSQSEAMKACGLSEIKHKMREDKLVPQYIRQALYETHEDMEHTTYTLQTASEGLKKCLENVIHEDGLYHRAPSMTDAHYKSLKLPFVERVGNKESAMLHWLQLSVNSANASQEGEANAKAEIEKAGKDEGDDNNNPDVLYEANVMQDQRILDDDDVIVYSSNPVGRSEELKVANPFVFSWERENEADGWQIQNAHRLRKKFKRIMILELSKKDVMPDERAETVTNVWNLSLEDRWRLYRRWLMDVRERYHRDISLLQYEFEAGVRRLRKIKGKLDLKILECADVVGMTTTGAAKHRELLEQLQPRITIVEEAAEVLESHIVTSLTPECQHLILIGDHQQLRPNPTVYELAKHYNLDVSLFERMVKNGMPFTRLRLQHRMRPEISKMLDHIYFEPKLENHESVMNFDNIMGVAHNAFFVDHEESEDFTEEGKSRSNEHEAKFMAALCRYFILQGYQREQITVLTAYTGQLFQLKKEMPKDIFRGVRVCAVDNFQGEENDIILLSLVRSNEEGKIGFLQIENRVCVALSRAKKGFFCIGNISLLETKSKLWSEIINDMRERGNVGNALMLTCQNHPQNVIHASRGDDFKKAPEGGCTVPCATRLECGHVCERLCHPTDPEHKEYKCNKPCTKQLCDQNHKCLRKCYQVCGPCLKTWPCGHEKETDCRVDPLHTPCKAPCGMTLKCEHLCAGNCSRCLRGRVHVPCRAKCDRTLFCGHSCTEPCTNNCPPCKENCGNYCKHSNCKKKCGDPCDPCKERCIWQCQHHRCTKLCGELCDRPRCNVPCTKLLPCQHPCIGLCGERCPKKCRECDKDEVTEIFFGTEDEPGARFVELADCGHVFEVEMMDEWMDQAETTHDGKPVVVQLKLCPKCRIPIRTSLRYGNIVKKILADVEKIKRKILLAKGQRDQQVQDVVRLKMKAQKIDEFPEDREKINRSLDFLVRRYKNLTDERQFIHSIQLSENQISMLSFLQTLKATVEAEELLQGSKEDLENKVKELRGRIMAFRFGFSDQELEELNGEIYRTQLLVDFRMLKMQLDTQGIKLGVTDTGMVDFVEVALDSEKTIVKKHREQYTARIKRIRREQDLRVLSQAVTRDREKDLIVRAMRMTQAGHWFKCQNGHIYCITECGGAMEESKCPECGL